MITSLNRVPGIAPAGLDAAVLMLGQTDTAVRDLVGAQLRQVLAPVAVHATEQQPGAVVELAVHDLVARFDHRAEECDKMLMPFKDIIRLIPEE